MIENLTTYRIKTDRWKRTWQAEWDYCLYACRAYTKRGVIRKAKRWYKNGVDVKQYMDARRQEVINGRRTTPTSGGSSQEAG